MTARVTQCVTNANIVLGLLLTNIKPKILFFHRVEFELRCGYVNYQHKNWLIQ